MAHQISRLPGTVLGMRTIRKVRRYKVWDCSSCGRKGYNSKKCHQCVGCGNSKDASDNEERSVTEVDANYQHTGADVTCQHCGTENVARFSCKTCGAALDKKFENIVKQFPSTSDLSWRERHVQADAEGFVPEATETPWNDGSTPVVLEEPVPEPEPEVVPVAKPLREEVTTKHLRDLERSLRRETPNEPRTKDSTVFGWALIVVALLVLAVIATNLYKRYNAINTSVATVVSVSWSYTLPLEDYAPRDHSYSTGDFAWHPPGNAFDEKSEPVIVDHEDIYDDVWVEKTCTKPLDLSYDDTDGTWVELIVEVDYDCSGNEWRKIGERPIYGLSWTWQELEWATTTPLTKKGDSYQVEYPPFTATADLRPSGDPITTFAINVTYVDDDGERHTTTRAYPRIVWEGTSIGAVYDAAVDGFNRLRAIKGLDPQYEELTK